MKKTTLMARVAMLVGAALVFLLAACQPEPPTPLTVADPAALDAMIDTYVADGSFPVLYARLE
ncbi:MAG: hypothetical protein AAF730_15310, partial [Bacteroidota bacterium]